MTIEKADTGIKICDMVKNLGYEKVFRGLSGYLKVASEFFNRNLNMTEAQAIQTACIIISEFPTFTFEDLVMAIKEAKSGRDGYEKVFAGLDGATICSWLNVYFERKWDFKEAQIEQQKKEYHNQCFDTRVENVEKFEELLKVIEGKERK